MSTEGCTESVSSWNIFPPSSSTSYNWLTNAIDDCTTDWPIQLTTVQLTDQSNWRLYNWLTDRNLKAGQSNWRLYNWLTNPVDDCTTDWPIKLTTVQLTDQSQAPTQLTDQSQAPTGWAITGCLQRQLGNRLQIIVIFLLPVFFFFFLTCFFWNKQTKGIQLRSVTQ